MKNKFKSFYLTVIVAIILFVLYYTVTYFISFYFVCNANEIETNNVDFQQKDYIFEPVLAETYSNPMETTEFISQGEEKKTNDEKSLGKQVKAPNETNLGKFKLTAYCSCKKCCGKYASNRPIVNGNPVVYTASGKIAKPDYTVAADTSILPFGTHIIINGKEYEVQDVGGAIKGNRIDIYFANHSDAVNFGVQYAEVFKK